MSPKTPPVTLDCGWSASRLLAMLPPLLSNTRSLLSLYACMVLPIFPCTLQLNLSWKEKKSVRQAVMAVVVGGQEGGGCRNKKGELLRAKFGLFKKGLLFYFPFCLVVPGRVLYLTICT